MKFKQFSRLCVLSVLIGLLCACSNEVVGSQPIENKVSVGETKGAEVIQRTWKSEERTVITTTEAIITVYGARSILLGQPAEVGKTPDGDNWLCIENEAYCWRMF